MLDTATKKRIDDCRDILVGKLPDPKAQVEQITIGLIYKFMDDMDKETIELGGEAKFFSGDFKKYSWDSLFDTKVTASEMLELYSSALESMEKNPNIPQLFRDIFKNAYLPYRSPETLKLFLKTIGEFEYSHSEKLGDAFEYLLSIMGSQGDAGQFRTPRHIIDFVVKIVDPGKGDTILDPACGTAGFLISAFKHIREKNKGSFTPDEQKKLLKNFVGYDISPDMVRLSLVNLYLHGFTDPHIHEYDSLSDEERWNETFDVILANPPFMSPKGGIHPHKKFTIHSSRSEVLFVDYIIEHLNPNGRAGIIVPEGVIFQTGKAYKKLRKMLVENALYAVVSLPNGIFLPYSGVKTSILLLDKEVAKRHDEILFVKIENDGFDLGAKRTAVSGSELDEAIFVTQKFISSDELQDSIIAHKIKKAAISSSGDYNLNGERYRTTRNIDISDFPHVTLGECCNILNGSTPSKNDETYWKNGTIPWFTIEDIRAQGRVITRTIQHISDKALKKTSVKLLPANTVLLCCTASVGEYAFTEIPLTTNQQFNGLVVKDEFKNRLKSRFLFHLSSAFKEELIRISGQTSFSFVSVGVLKTLQIPLPPLSVQEEIVEEIEGYQKIIDGAKAVIKNYKPRIDVDPEWEMVELGDVCDFIRGPFGGSLKKEIFVEDGYAVYEQSHAIYNQFEDFRYFVDEKKFNEMSRFEVFPNDIIMSCSGTMGKVSIVPEHSPKGIINQALLKLSTHPEKLSNVYLKLWMDSDNFQKLLHSNVHGAAIVNVASVKTLKALKIPLPELQTQQQIVAQIEGEQKLVDANRKLIESFERKIKDRIVKVWGE